MKYGDVPVTLSNGLPGISVPIYTVEENGMQVPISLSYHAGGIKVDEPASWTGLGWSLSAGGAITREVRGLPDDNEAEIGFFSFVQTNDYYLNHATSKVRDSVFKEASQGRLDLEPDIFYFNAPGIGGKFAFDQETRTFTSLPQQPVKISRDATFNTWKILAPDGTSYYFENKETTTSTTKCDVEVNNFNSVISAWYLSKIVNANQTDSIMFDYSYVAYDYYSAGSSTTYTVLTGDRTLDRPNLNCFSHNYFSGYSRLSGIRTRKYIIEFIKAGIGREDIKDDYALNRINVKSVTGQLIKSYTLNYDYYNSLTCSSQVPDPARNQKRLRLLSVDERGKNDAESPLSYKFTYDSQTLPCRLSYSQDLWGYPNGASNTNPNTLVPKETFIGTRPDGSVVTMTIPGADRSPSEDKMKSGILTKIEYPTGGTTSFEFEANKIGYAASKYIPPKIKYKSQILSDIRYNNEYLDYSYEMQFVINEPPSSLNGYTLTGGVFASAIVEPMCDAANPTACGDYILMGPKTVTFTNTFDNVYLPNGTYTLRAMVSRINDTEPESGFRYFSCSVTYPVLDSSQSNGFLGNYVAGGLRIKRIINSDSVKPQTNNIREFRYHNPVNDSSYGRLLNIPVFNHYETVDVTETLPQGGGWAFKVNYLVRAGNSMVPFVTTQGGYVFYPKVTEYILGTAGNQRTDYQFSFVPAEIDENYPFTPSYDPDWQRGNNEMTTVYRLQDTIYSPQQVTATNFNYYPVSSSNQPFYKDLLAILTGNKNFYVIKDANDEFNTGMLEPELVPIVSQYMVPTGRFYKQSDTTMTIDPMVNKLTLVNSYKYGDTGQQLIEQKSTDSKGQVRTTKYSYPTDGELSTSHISSTVQNKMISENRLTTPLVSSISVNTAELKKELLFYNYQGKILALDSLQSSFYSAVPALDMAILQYDTYGNPITIKQRDGLFRKYIWAKDRGIVQASCISPVNANVVFTSFEYPGELSWNEASRTSSKSFTGKMAYQLSGASISITGLDAASRYFIYIWIENGASCTVDGVSLNYSGRSFNGWRLMSGTLTSKSQCVISGSGLVDHLTIVPEKSVFEGNVYDDAYHITSKTDNRALIYFYEYDSMGRLKVIRDQEGNILKQVDYQYQAPLTK
ncbi:RHS repeat domain-containing protein [Chitinophaga filiformis]|nr:RHS repeat domain-containing protein [Chitinophaga filiformis]